MNSSRLLCASLLLAASGLQAQPPAPANPKAPTLNPIPNLGAQRGAAVDLTLAGTNLTNPTGVWVSFPAKVTIPTDANNGKNAASLRVRLELPADAPLGFHSIRLATKNGMSNARL